jgi:para-nitrobenzyl esterase
MLRRFLPPFLISLIVLSAVSGCVHRPPPPLDLSSSGTPVRVETTNGPVVGVKTQDLSVFQGIPYAKAPVGELRFRPPAEPDRWNAPVQATRFGAVCPQVENEYEPSSMYPQSEDCLSLNVWTPAADAGKRPVLVYIHGGGFFEGASSRPLYDGANFARRGNIVFVSINYRLGALGFTYLEQMGDKFDGSGNLGLLDQAAALSWIARNIDRFGGDPSAVTIMGESAGAISVLNLMTMPVASGLFARAIAQSAAPSLNRNVDRAIANTEKYMQLAGVSDAGGLRALPVADVIKAQKKLMKDAGIGAELLFMPVIDGRVVAKDTVAAFDAGDQVPVPLMHGTTKDEFRLWLYISPLIKYVSPETFLNKSPDMKARLGDNAGRIIVHYKKEYPHLHKGEIAMMLAGDIVFWVPHVRISETHSLRAPTYMYEFDWPTPVKGGEIGSHHGLDVPFVFHNLDVENAEEFLGPNPPAALADAMIDTWISFVKTGVPKVPGGPDWPVYDIKRRSTMTFNLQCRLVDDIRPADRLIYKGILY